ncbi:hypothetical protein BDN67DRAFT_77167 [Paxillus ammoniavirescens]|nr:hypothetical protein BDN67DRAFT_77167 [Paxillus ammoniavirescens]
MHKSCVTRKSLAIKLLSSFPTSQYVLRLYHLSSYRSDRGSGTVSFSPGCHAARRRRSIRAPRKFTGFPRSGSTHWYIHGSDTVFIQVPNEIVTGSNSMNALAPPSLADNTGSPSTFQPYTDLGSFEWSSVGVTVLQDGNTVVVRLGMSSVRQVCQM